MTLQSATRRSEFIKLGNIRLFFQISTRVDKMVKIFLDLFRQQGIIFCKKFVVFLFRNGVFYFSGAPLS